MILHPATGLLPVRSLEGLAPSSDGSGCRGCVYFAFLSTGSRSGVPGAAGPGMWQASVRSGLVWGLLVVLGLLAVYLPGLGNELVFDDWILANGQIHEHYGGLLQLKQRMLSYGSFVWLDALPWEGWWKHRLFNIALHIAVVFSLYTLYCTLIPRIEWPADLASRPEADSSRTAALRVGMLVFAFNPVAVYAVAYLVQRSILSATLFVVLACLCFTRGVIFGRFVWFVAAAVSYVLALLCKEHAVMTPLLAVPLYVFLKRPGWRQTAVIVGGTAVLVGVAVGLMLMSYGKIIGAPFDELSQIYMLQLKAIDPAIEARIWPLSILNQAALFFYYGFLWFVPNIQWMSIDIRPPFPLSFAAWPQLAGALGYVVIFVLAVWQVLKRSGVAGFAGMCALFPLLLFATEFSTVWVQDPFVLYRSYLWAIGVPGLVMLLFVGARARTIYATGFVIATVLGGLALERVFSFEHTLSVWSDAADKVDLKAPPNAVGRWRPFLNRGSYYLENTMAETAYNDFVRADALGELQGSASYNMGVSLQLMRRHEDAIKALNLAEKRGFLDAGLFYHRAESSIPLGHFDEAVKDLTKSIALTGDERFAAHARLRRAEAALQNGQYDLARQDFTALLAAAPDDYKLGVGRAMAIVGLKDGATALQYFDALLEKRVHPSALYGRALALRLQGRSVEAAAALDRAIALDPDNPVYQNLRAQISGRS